MNSYPITPKNPHQTPPARKVFVSYHHEKDQFYANWLREFNGSDNTFIDRSLPEEIDSDNNDYILSIIRTRHLRTSTVTIVLIGSETWTRKWVDWEIYSTLRPYGLRTINGLLGILLPHATKLPPRFEANFSVVETPQGWLQNGYARLIHWEDIGPFIPTTNPIENVLVTLKRKKYLKDTIENAFYRRTRIQIHNDAPRYKKDRPSEGEIW